MFGIVSRSGLTVYICICVCVCTWMDRERERERCDSLAFRVGIGSPSKHKSNVYGPVSEHELYSPYIIVFH